MKLFLICTLSCLLFGCYKAKDPAMYAPTGTSAPVDTAPVDKPLPSTVKVMFCDKYSILGIGNSLTRGVGGVNWTTQLAAMYNGTVRVNYIATSGAPSYIIADQFIARPDQYSRNLVIWIGRNNYRDTARVLADIDRIKKAAGHDRYIILTEINGNYVSEYRGHSDYNTIVALNARLKEKYAGHVIDVRQKLVNSFNPTSVTDALNYDYDIPPASVRADNIHLKTAGYGIVAQALFDSIEWCGCN